MQKTLLFILITAMVLLLPLNVPAETMQGHKSPGKMNKMDMAQAQSVQKAVYLPMADPGKKVVIGGGYYLIYGFDKKPKLGTVIMKVDVFAADGSKETALTIKADAGMPSMRGAHETGDRPFQLSKKGSYLLPISIVMPGDWEIRLSVLKEGQVIFRGRYNFDI